MLINNKESVRRLVVGSHKRAGQTIEVDLTPYAGRTVTLRLYQNLITNTRLRPASAAHWKSIILR